MPKFEHLCVCIDPKIHGQTKSYRDLIFFFMAIDDEKLTTSKVT